MPQSLEELWKTVETLNNKYFPGNKLKPIVGNGKTDKPKFMFVFINPTHANISSDPNWQGPRFPFIGTKPVWRIFHRAGLLDDGLIERINNSKYWSLEFTDTVLDFLKSKSFYFTNIVKWTGSDASLPGSEKIDLFMPILEEEINIVQPEYIVTFGLIPFEHLAKQKIKLQDYHSNAMQSSKLKAFDVIISSRRQKIIPCYFPIGRGNPKKAVDILKLLP